MNAKRDERARQGLQRVLDLLELTAKNQAIAEQYFDLAKPQAADLLKETEPQNFWKFQRNTKQELYYFLTIWKAENAELAERFVRFMAEIGRETSQGILAYWGNNKEYEYLGHFLPASLQAAIYANACAWDFDRLRMTYLSPLVKTGLREPEIFQQARELCCNNDGVNTQMLLAALYLYCVKPLEETKGGFRISMDGDQRAAGNPKLVRTVTDYLENRLINNIDGLFEQGFKPEGKDLETLQHFVRNSGLDVPIPKEVWQILSGRRKNNYLMAFLSFLAFLAVEHSDRFGSLLRLTVAFDFMSIPNVPLDKCLATGDDWFRMHIMTLEKCLEIPDDMYIRWALSNKQTEILERMAVKAPETVCEVLEDIPVQEKGILISCVKTGNAQMYHKRKELFAGSYRRAAAEQTVDRFDFSQDEALRYLLGELGIADILCFVAGWREMHNLEYWDTRCRNIQEYKIFGDMQIYSRALVLECLRLDHNYVDHYWIDPEQDMTEKVGYYDVRQAKAVLKLMDQEMVPPQYQIEFLGTAYDDTYASDQIKPEIKECVKTIAVYHKDWHQEWVTASQSRLIAARILAIQVMDIQWEEYRADLLSCASESSKQARELLRAIYTAHRELEQDIVDMLKSPRGEEREMAVSVLDSWGAEKYQEPLKTALGAEKTKKLRTMLQTILGVGSQGDNGQPTTKWPLKKLTQETLAGTWKRKLSWLPLDTFPKVHKKDESEDSADILAAVLVSYADMKELGINQDAQRLAAELNPAELAFYIKEVYHFWLGDGAQAKRKWVLYAAAIHGGDSIVPDLYAQIQDWPKNARGAMAAEAVKALALNPSPTALVMVDQISRKFKYHQVKNAAAQALDYAAGQLGITRDEMEDRIVPSLGFDQQMERIFDYGKRQFKVALTPTLSLEVYDEKGKQLKNMPAPGKTDDAEKAKAANEAWKSLKKQLKTVVANQKLRLEQALGADRHWTTTQWKELYVKNPVMRQFAIGLIWGVYDDKNLSETFRYMEDGTFNTVDEEEYILPENGSIGLVHPIELSEEILSAWKEQLSDYEITQPVEQLERPVFRVTEEEKEEMELTRFGGVVVNSLSLSGKLQNMGWHKGEVGDGGGFDTYYRHDGDKNVELDFSGDFIACLDTDVIVYGAHFGRSMAGESQGLAPCRLGETDPRYFSETVLQLTRATASSAERRPYPDCKRQHWY